MAPEAGAAEAEAGAEEESESKGDAAPDRAVRDPSSNPENLTLAPALTLALTLTQH